MIRWGRAVFAATVVVTFLAGCDGGDDWNPEAPFAPSLRPAFGARVTDGRLQIWTGSPCVGVTRLALTFEPDRAELVLEAPRGRPATVERLTLGGPYPGLEITTSLPDGFDWRRAESARISVYGATDSWGSSVGISDVVEGSDRHANNAYYFGGVGWLDAAGVADQDGNTFLATCTPDPAGK